MHLITDFRNIFFFKGKPLSITHHTIKPTDKLARIEEILSKHSV